MAGTKESARLYGTKHRWYIVTSNSQCICVILLLALVIGENEKMPTDVKKFSEIAPFIRMRKFPVLSRVGMCWTRWFHLPLVYRNKGSKDHTFRNHSGRRRKETDLDSHFIGFLRPES